MSYNPYSRKLNQSTLAPPLVGEFSKEINLPTGVTLSKDINIIDLGRLDSLPSSDTFILDYLSRHETNIRNCGIEYLNPEDLREFISGGAPEDFYESKILTRFVHASPFYFPSTEQFKEPIKRFGFAINTIKDFTSTTVIFIRLFEGDESLKLRELRVDRSLDFIELNGIKDEITLGGIECLNYLIIQLSTNFLGGGTIDYVKPVSTFQSIPVRRPDSDQETNFSREKSKLVEMMKDGILYNRDSSLIADTGFGVVIGSKDIYTNQKWCPRKIFYKEGEVVDLDGSLYEASCDIKGRFLKPSLDWSGCWIPYIK